MKKLAMIAAVGGLIFSSCSKEPSVDFTMSATSVKMNETVKFTNGAEEKKAYNFQWSFGDGGSAATKDAAHAYTSPGTYTVTLTASNKKGNKFTSVSKDVTVSKLDMNSTSGAESANWEDASNTYGEANAKVANMLLGKWTFSSIRQDWVDCSGTGSTGSYSGNSDALTTTVEFLADGSALVMDHNGNKMTTNWSLTAENYLNISGLSQLRFPYEVDNGIERTFQLGMDMHMASISGSSATLTGKMTTSNTNGSGSKCDNTVTNTVTLTKS